MKLALNLIALFGMGIGIFVLWKIFGNSVKAYFAKNKKVKADKKSPKEAKRAKSSKKDKKAKTAVEVPEEIELKTIETKKEGLSLGEWRNVK
jgi:hypothetical protein